MYCDRCGHQMNIQNVTFFPLAESHMHHTKFYVCKQCNLAYDINETREKLEKKSVLLMELVLANGFPKEDMDWFIKEWDKIKNE